MIAHIVLLQPKDTTTDEELIVLLEHVQALQQVIPDFFHFRRKKPQQLP